MDVSVVCSITRAPTACCCCRLAPPSSATSLLGGLPSAHTSVSLTGCRGLSVTLQSGCLLAPRSLAPHRRLHLRHYGMPIPQAAWLRTGEESHQLAGRESSLKRTANCLSCELTCSEAAAAPCPAAVRRQLSASRFSCGAAVASDSGPSRHHPH